MAGSHDERVERRANAIRVGRETGLKARTQSGEAKATSTGRVRCLRSETHCPSSTQYQQMAIYVTTDPLGLVGLELLRFARTRTKTDLLTKSHLTYRTLCRVTAHRLVAG